MKILQPFQSHFAQLDVRGLGAASAMLGSIAEVFTGKLGFTRQIPGLVNIQKTMENHHF
jgi:hypothetical protein